MYPFHKSAVAEPAALVFSTDGKSSTPRLRFADESRTTVADLSAWSDQLSRQYERYDRVGAVKEIEFQTPIKGLPRRYRVEVRPTRSKGVPELLLTPLAHGAIPASGEVDAPGAAGSAEAESASGTIPVAGAAKETAGAGHGKSQPGENALLQVPELVQTLRTLFEHVPLQQQQQLSIDQVLSDLDEIAAQNPKALLLLMLAGYLRMCLDRQHTNSQTQLALMGAAITVDELCAVLIDDVKEEATPSAVPIGRNFQRSFRRLYEQIAEQLKLG